MSRRWQQAFQCEPLDDLTRQLVRSPTDKRIEQVRRAEALHDEIEPAKAYPFDFLAYRLTGFRSNSGDAVLLIGEPVRADLRLMIETLSRSVEMPLLGSETAFTADQLASRFNVSTKTITRWRKIGLRWRWVKPASGGRKAVMFLKPAVERFVAEHGDRVGRAAGFRPMPLAERQRLITRARRIAAQRDVSLNRVADHLAKRTGRALETVRLILEKHDRRHPGRRIFLGRRGPLTSREKRIVARAHRMGVAISKIAERFGRTHSTIYRALHERRAARARRITLSCVDSPNFDRPDADQVILGKPLDPLPNPALNTRRIAPIAGLPDAVAALYCQPTIDDAHLRSWFIRFNYLKHKAIRIRDRFDRYEPRVNDLDRFDDCIAQAGALRHRLVRIHLPIVLSVARRQQLDHAGESDRLLHLLEIGNEVLIEAVESYNAGRPTTFDSYLTNLLLRRFVTTDNRGGKDRARQRIDPDDMLDRLIEQAAARGVRLKDKHRE